ncbi:uncharacterized protein Triagg1_7555 [Trichoderma aggressivum f. europaeum]|uniref:Uncharacterized protein n=1 Tax=Trichoderma aggressivum f. europaeum TaxID=173218 RepID=A0AAE1LYH3_9HYPO|nr:hypothetical protein Triagg1_7555 [Trichoderma aggressivum f. europaeum]
MAHMDVTCFDLSEKRLPESTKQNGRASFGRSATVGIRPARPMWLYGVSICSSKASARGYREENEPSTNFIQHLRIKLCAHGAGTRCLFFGSMADLVLVLSPDAAAEKKKKQRGVALSCGVVILEEEDAHSMASKKRPITPMAPSVCVLSGGNGFMPIVELPGWRLLEKLPWHLFLGFCAVSKVVLAG